MPAEYTFTGLSNQQVDAARARYGKNEIIQQENHFYTVLLDLLKDPMLLLLLAAAFLYFISGQTGDGIFMLVAVLLVSSISLFQEARSRNALASLKTLTQPTSAVIRDSKRVDIKREEIVIGDLIIVEEGNSIPADAIIIQSNDFAVNESILTGESLSINKDKDGENNHIFQGTTVTSGLAICRVTAIGEQTALGKIGKSLEDIKEEKTPLEKQIANFVKNMALIGIVIFLLVWGINFIQSREVLDSLLKAFTLAMSILPEEIPVAFTTFMALGTWRFMKMGIIVKHTKTVETLGSATVICVDKTGTITSNKMSLAKVFVLSDNRISTTDTLHENELTLLTAAMWASEPIPFDPMEIALHEAYRKTGLPDERGNFKMIHEYPLSGRPPMMTHIFEHANGKRIIAAKGAPEAMMQVASLSENEKRSIESALQTLTAEGFRVLGVGIANHVDSTFPATQQEFNFTFLGLVAFYDPPKENIHKVFNAFYEAGIAIKIITGDNAATTSTIAKQVGFRGAEKTMSGDALAQLTEVELRNQVMDVNIFTRMFPDAKLRILNALKANNQIVAMTGDGVNDGPALKASHIGIAMGKKGTEIAKEVSSLILTDDDLTKMVDAIAMGRKIYTNLKKAIQYIISIHIPIILVVLIPLLLGWIYPSIFSPVHVIFLELIMGPTCSIIYENEPMEKNTMMQKPRPFTTTFFNGVELRNSIIQGLVISIGCLTVYQLAVYHEYSETITRTMVFITLLTANIFLTLVNRSFYYSIFTTLQYKNNLVPLIIAVTIGLTATVVYIPSVAQFFEFDQPTGYQLISSVLIGFVSVVWFEFNKAWKRKRQHNLVSH